MPNKFRGFRRFRRFREFRNPLPTNLPGFKNLEGFRLVRLISKRRLAAAATGITALRLACKHCDAVNAYIALSEPGDLVDTQIVLQDVIRNDDRLLLLDGDAFKTCVFDQAEVGILLNSTAHAARIHFCSLLQVLRQLTLQHDI